MRILPLLLPTSLLVVASGTGAQTPGYPQIDAAPITTIQVSAPVKTVLIRAEQAREIAGSYHMSNGWKLKVRPASRYIDATIDDQKPMRLLAVSADKFVAKDGSVTMEFNQGDRENAMSMRYFPNPALAQEVEISAVLAQR